MRAMNTNPAKVLLLASLILCTALTHAPASTSTESIYRQPDQTLVDIIDAPKTPRMSLNPPRTWMLLMERPSYPSIEELAERELGLAGMRIKPQTFGPSRTRPYSGLLFVRIADLEEHRITGLPEKARIENVTWSSDGARIAFTNTTENGIELWTADVASAAAGRLTAPSISMTARVTPRWLLDGKTLIACFVPGGHGSEPSPPRVPA